MLGKMKLGVIVLVIITLGVVTACGHKNRDVVEVVGMETMEVENLSGAEETVVEKQQEVIEEVKTRIKVYICGAISKANVYELEEGDRICDVIEEAGGFTKEASQTYLNQAEILEDGQKIYVPTCEEVELGNVLMPSNSMENEKVNINTASLEKLMTLSGVGEAKAQAIIAYREEQGGFEKIEEIQEINGIKEAVFQSIKDQICV